ncbi:MAG TPA: GNAT family N-acetyltransferase [Thermoleophilaceae bacterium]|nr:GNAT family N-acetyltransferase [Thermoleophilaceae bacterium]
MGERAHAELIADCGAAARSDDLFRSRAFLDAEGTTHTLRLTSPDRSALVPLIVREIEGTDRRDAVSPYGYPGATVEGGGSAAVAGEVDWSETGLVSIFARERLVGEPWLASARERSRVLIHDPDKPRRTRARLAEQIRANERAGWSVEATPGPTSTAADRDAFAIAYEQTMRRAEAAERYFFAREYFDAVLSFDRSWLLVARREREPGASAIAAVSDSTLHYYLGATADAALAGSPFKNVVASMLALADELELPLNLGGGVTAGDGLEAFKRGFANAELPFLTHEVICDPEEYERLGGADGCDDLFPAYRAGGGEP